MMVMQSRQRAKDIPFATLSLIVLILLVFSISFFMKANSTLIKEYGFPSKSMIIDIGSSNLPRVLIHDIEMLISSLFIHVDLLHIFTNLVPLAFFGIIVERRWGKIALLSSFFIAGIAGAVVHSATEVLIFKEQNTILVGASAGICGILGLAAASGQKSAYYSLVFDFGFLLLDSLTGVRNIAYVAHFAGFASIFGTVTLIRFINMKLATHDVLTTGQKSLTIQIRNLASRMISI